MSSPPEAWLRGPIEGIDPHLIPVAHALVQAEEDMDLAAAGFGITVMRLPAHLPNTGRALAAAMVALVVWTAAFVGLLRHLAAGLRLR